MTAQTSNKQISLFLLFSLASTIVVIDRATKLICDANLVMGIPVTVFPGFDLLLAYNTGAAFSFLDDAGGWQRWFLTGISLSISIFIMVWLTRIPRSQRLLGIALALILGGALGNLYDRMLAGYVIDFISVYAGAYRFATFNIADSAVSVGAVLMVLDMVIDMKRQPVSGPEN
jgi:signal peptidase II